MIKVKDFLSPKKFSRPAYVCVILHSICGVILIAITTALRLGETEKFSCAVEPTFTIHKKYVEKTCFSVYDDVYNFPVRLFAFILFSFIPVAVVSVIYSLAVGSRIDKTERYLNRRNSPLLNDSNQPGTRSLYVFYFYFFHLVARSIFGMLFIILQFTVLYPNSFDSEFICIYPKLTQQDLNITTAKNVEASVTCGNLVAHDKQFCSYAVFGCNLIFTLIMLLEVILIIRGLTERRRFPYFKPKFWSCDLEFIINYFLRKHVPEDNVLVDADIPTSNSAQIYREKVLNAPLTSDINYGLDTYTSLDDVFIDLVIQAEQAPLKFSKDMTRHEIYDVYMKVPENSIRLGVVKDLFYPDNDTKGRSPRTILALGRPGIGKTVLTSKIMQDWAKGIDRFYHGKIAFFFKFGWFHFKQLQNVILKEFLQLGTKLRESEFECIFAEIWTNPQNAIFIFDGFDEFGGNLEKFHNFLDQSKMSPDDPTCPMSAMFLFIKILSGQILPGATVLVTSRPTANDVLSKLHFDRKVEIIGFTEEKIERYVVKFCANHEKSELKTKIWNHIKSSELKNLCYIPLNCFIVCVTLLNCLRDQDNDNALPATLTELYLAVLVYFHMYHDRNETKEQYEKVIKDLQQLAFHGMENNRLIFDDEFDNEQMKESGLLHCSPVPFFQIRTQVCFIHLTVQEFLAAKHIVETKEPQEIKEFISSHVEEGKWHLVLQFLAGLLGKKMRMSLEFLSCVLAFGECLCSEVHGKDTVCVPYSVQIMLMKCLRETQDEDIAKEITMTSALRSVSCLHNFGLTLSPSDCAAIVFLCKYMGCLRNLTLLNIASLNCLIEIIRLFHYKCIESLKLSFEKTFPVQVGLELILNAMTMSKCPIKHKHCQLTLDLDGNDIEDEGVHLMCRVLKEEDCKLTALSLQCCSLTDECMPYLCDALKNDRCTLTKLNLKNNCFGGKYLSLLSDTLKLEQCCLQRLSISADEFTPEQRRYLMDVEESEHCKARGLTILFL